MSARLGVLFLERRPGWPGYGRDILVRDADGFSDAGGDAVDALGRSMLMAAVDGRMADVSIFSPASPQAGWIVDLAILTLAIIGIIFLVVEGVLFYSVWRFRRSKSDAPRRTGPGLRQRADRNRLDRGADDDRLLPGARHHADAVGGRSGAGDARARETRRCSSPSSAINGGGSIATTATTAASSASSRPTSCTSRSATTRTARPVHLTLQVGRRLP